MKKNNKEEAERWKRLYERFYNSLCFFSNSIINNPEKAEDIVQSILIKLWQDNILFENIQHTQNYLYKSVRNASINEINTSNNQEKILQKLALENPDYYKQDDHFYNVVKAEVYKQIEEAVDKLPTKTAQVFQLAFLDQKTNTEIAELLAISVNTVKAHKASAKNKLQILLKDLEPFVLFFILQNM